MASFSFTKYEIWMDEFKRLGRSKNDCDALRSIVKEFRLIIHSMALSYEMWMDEV